MENTQDLQYGKTFPEHSAATKGSKLYACGVIDVATRRLVGWSIKRHQRQDIVQDAFEMAVGRNPERPADAV